MRTRNRLAALGAALALGTGGLLAAAPASAAPVGPCDRPEGIYATSSAEYIVQNCRATAQNLQLIIIDDGAVIHRDPCTTVAPAGELRTLNLVPDWDAYWSWSYC